MKIGAYDIFRGEQKTIIIRQEQISRSDETITRKYYRFNGVECPCGGRWLVAHQVKLRGLRTTALRCMKCSRVPVMSHSEAMREIIEDVGFYRMARGAVV